MKSITSVFVFILAASFSLGTPIPKNPSEPIDTKIPITINGGPGVYYNNYFSVLAIAKINPEC